MSSPHEYHRSNTPASLHDDHDSDLDLDLDELDPTTSSQPAPARKPQRHNRTTSYDIPLRNLRLGGLRGYKRAARRQDADAEDLTALVGDDEVEDTQKRESAASSGTGGDDAPCCGQMQACAGSLNSRRQH
ncbi:putative aminophospholipid-translocase [Taxawa tesnikishii (nom. ined.)]|nr:putative aminophospholipid-translocase [Dothideales sp. JES 119]